MRAATASPAMRRSASICSATVTDTLGMVRLRRGPSVAPSIVAARSRKFDGGARRRVGVPHVLGDRQHRLLAVQRLADDAGEEARRRLVGLAGPHADRRQPDADAVEEAAPGVVGKQQFADRLLRAVAGERRQ